MKRIKFKVGKQRKFFEDVMRNSNCPSLRTLNQFGFSINYSTLKSYYNENRTLPEDFFIQLCHLGKIDSKKLDIVLLNENWGQIKGGKN